MALTWTFYLLKLCHKTSQLPLNPSTVHVVPWQQDLFTGVWPGPGSAISHGAVPIPTWHAYSHLPNRFTLSCGAVQSLASLWPSTAASSVQPGAHGPHQSRRPGNGTSTYEPSSHPFVCSLPSYTWEVGHCWEHIAMLLIKYTSYKKSIKPTNKQKILQIIMQ